MFIIRRAAKIRHAADIPKQAHALRAGEFFDHLGQARQIFQRQDIIGIARARQPRVIGRLFQRPDQAFGRGEIKVSIAPHQFANGFKLMRFNRLDLFFVKRPRLACDAKGAVFGMPPRTPCDLADFLHVQHPHPAPVKLGGRGEGDVFDIKVQPHANRIGGHQIIHLAVLIHGNLRVARARA